MGMVGFMLTRLLHIPPGIAPVVSPLMGLLGGERSGFRAYSHEPLLAALMGLLRAGREAG